MKSTELYDYLHFPAVKAIIECLTSQFPYSSDKENMEVYNELVILKQFTNESWPNGFYILEPLFDKVIKKVSDEN